MSLTAPEGVKAALRRALAWIEEGKGGDGLEPATIREANRLADGDACTLAKAKKALRFYGRNARYPKLPGFKPGSDGYPSPARVSWDLWGGNDGPGFYRRVVRQLQPVKRDAAPGTWGDPLTDYADKLEEMVGLSLGWLSDPVDPEATDPAEMAGDGSREEEDWSGWVQDVVTEAVTATALGVAVDSARVRTWRTLRITIIRGIAGTTARGIEAGADADLPADLVYGLTPQQVAAMVALRSELQARGYSDARIRARLVQERDALRLRRAEIIAETELVNAHSGATQAAWLQAQDEGILPAIALRRWKAVIYSGLICGVCAYLHLQERPLDVPFTGPDGEEINGPGWHMLCRCHLELVKESMEKNVERGLEAGNYVLPEVMTVDTAPPVATTAMGPVALAFFVAVYNAHTAAGLLPDMALECAWGSMYGAGFCRQPDGTFRRPENWDASLKERAEWYKTQGVMRAGKVISAANATMLRSMHSSLTAEADRLDGFLESCGYGMKPKGGGEGEEMEVEDSAERSVSRHGQIFRAAPTGDSFIGWASPATDDDGNEIVDQHGTHFSVGELDRAMDVLAMEGGRLKLDQDHEAGDVYGMATQAMVITREIQDYLRAHPNRTGLMVKGVMMTPEGREAVRTGKFRLSIAGRAAFTDKKPAR